ncbi:hypothetical protein V490_04859 [Pseudogymnoascus sp. VKM F-3557]|nr:hypothetical protein V490_04859 [Pseudogymnoascus sp. VKM F-3557]
MRKKFQNRSSRSSFERVDFERVNFEPIASPARQPTMAILTVLTFKVWRKFDDFSTDMRKSIIPLEYRAGARDALGFAQIRRLFDIYAQVGSNDTRPDDARRNGKRSKRSEALA